MSYSDWILNYIKLNGPVDILNSEFVEKFILENNVDYMPTNFGAFKCPTLNKELSKLVKNNQLVRHTVGVGSWQPGFPKWVYSYDIIQS